MTDNAQKNRFSKLTKRDLINRIDELERKIDSEQSSHKAECNQLSSEHFKALVDRLPTGIFRISLDGKFTYANAAFATLTGYSLKELNALEDGWSVFWDKETWQQHRIKLLSEETLIIKSYVLVRKDKSTCSVKISIYLRREKGTDNVFCEGIVEDITSEKILQHQFIQTEKMAALGGLVSGVAHEINNPLAIISGYAELLLNDDALNDSQQMKVRNIYDSGQRCAKIVTNMLGFARESEIKSANLDINEVLDNALILRDYEFKVNNIVVIRKFSKDIPQTLADFQLLKQVFLNLFNNAFDSMIETNKKGTLIVKSSVQSNTIIVEVIDDGPGIPDDIRDRLFDPFFTTKSPGKGTGLGLSLSFGIVEEHGGRIYIDNTQEKGSKFVVEIPVKEFIQEESDSSAASDQGKTYESRAIVVDDEMEIVELIREILELRNIKVDVAESGLDAIDLLKENQYTLALFDIRMPGTVNGMDLYLYVEENCPGLLDNVVFVTGDTVSEDIKTFLSDHDVHLIQKPFQIKDLNEKIDEVITV